MNGEEALRGILQMLQHLDGDELRAVNALVAKLLEGKRKHGTLELATDTRDFRQEKREEALDWLWYEIFHWLRRDLPSDS